MKKVLITDDQSGWRSFNSKAVYEVLGNDTNIETASSAAEAYSKLLESKDNPYDYLLTDMQMETNYLPKLAGEWLIEQAKTLPFCYKTKIIIISATSHIKYIAENYGTDYIPKSVAAVSSEAFKEVLLN